MAGGRGGYFARTLRHDTHINRMFRALPDSYIAFESRGTGRTARYGAQPGPTSCKLDGRGGLPAPTNGNRGAASPTRGTGACERSDPVTNQPGPEKAAVISSPAPRDGRVPGAR
ncbi:hypothetical protein VFPBJ_07148 [Purpureocillium lilacinum]|uniref:Uncharacterized protein n=1 Tax=Purpureocillium lilacinum TaxID=33203 RepID=A0A179GM98_PURLI|nr:hypothetical protein VFPBJ_07148 [Purpureocillium lilacinum]